MARRLLSSGYTVAVYNRNPDKAVPSPPPARWSPVPRAKPHRMQTLSSAWSQTTALPATCGSAKMARWRGSSRIGLDRVQHTDGRLDQRARPCRRTTGMRISRRPGHWHEAACSIGGIAIYGWRIRLGAGRARPSCRCSAVKSVHLGPTGSGTLLKLINNFMCGVQAASFAEAADDDQRRSPRS